ncbi:MAG: ribosomal RNA small subunit methyltransferase A [Candidatus Taylorbacteria bacterium]|nr:ribosomal RNA small subunit methyltransferase A [Candidatus Taylorbacteria bacterium]
MFQKKSLGQNFLKSEKALNEIIEASDIRSTDTVLEIGPGEGVLTARILDKKPKRLMAVEKDDRLIPILEQKFTEPIQRGDFSLVHADIIDLFTKNEVNIDKPFKIIANIPYYITGLIIRNIFSMQTLPDTVVLLVQKEVADRIVDTEKNNLLRASITLYGDVKRISVVPKGAFVPAPNVDSAILRIQNIQKVPSNEFEKTYFEIVKAAFAHKRKKASKNLAGILGISSTAWETVFAEFSLSKDVRPEDISTDVYKQITNKVIH